MHGLMHTGGYQDPRADTLPAAQQKTVVSDTIAAGSVEGASRWRTRAFNVAGAI